jgi:hypothetical protein
MHPMFSSREQDLAATPTHQALLRNLGLSGGTPFGKSEQHRQLLNSLLQQSGNTHAGSHAPARVHSQIARSSKSAIDREAERKFGKRTQRQRDRRDEDETLDRMSRAREQDGTCSLSKSTAPGSFNRMRKRFQADPSNLMHKALMSDEQIAAATLSALAAMYGQRSAEPAVSDAFDFEEKFGKGFTAHASEPVTIRATVKPRTAAKPTVASVKQSLGRVQAMVKSLGLDGIGENAAPVVPQPQRFTAEQIEAATAACLAAGKCTGAQAATISTCIAMGSMPPPELMACLTGESA